VTVTASGDVAAASDSLTVASSTPAEAHRPSYAVQVLFIVLIWLIVLAIPAAVQASRLSRG
jgi:hypothetical protein